MFVTIRPSAKTIAIILALLGALLLSISMMLAKKLPSEVSTLLIVFIKSCCGLILFVPYFAKHKVLLLRTDKLYIHLLRIVLLVGAMLVNYYAYRNLPIILATSIGMTEALFTAIFSKIILKEDISPLKWVLIFTGYLGVTLIIMKPSISLEAEPIFFTSKLAIVAALLANILAANCAIITKILSKHDSIITIVLYTYLGTSIVSFLSLTLNIDGLSVFELLTIQDIAILFSIAILGVSAQLCYTTAIKYSTPILIVQFQYIRILFATLIGVVVFKEQLTILTIIGSIIIICSAYLINFKPEFKKKVD
ncbi:eamA-like transporter family protein [Orientia chuto str. Dubai]|uniref:S-adenosylmethionine uptake transporter n=1 Tax=Orientia chuto str. Dubai TaxID=1359168 RepID=A0A0F3MLT7_9RICK|nr:DMT family transporter [Candidatus Orientia mediorientalis]KJV56733.1 eamA-like transporter family protein [Orientia chuto str. Dubai]